MDKTDPYVQREMTRPTEDEAEANGRTTDPICGEVIYINGTLFICTPLL